MQPEMTDQQGTSRILVQRILMVTVVVVVVGTLVLNLWRYHSFRTAWPLDLAFFNHQLWNLTHDSSELTLQPGNFYATEGPEPWRMAQMRLLTWFLVPIYYFVPGIPTLFVIQSMGCGLSLIPLYRIASRQSKDPFWALMAVLFVAFSCPLWMVGTLDFRYLTLGIPFALAAYDALEERKRGWFMFFAVFAMMSRHVFAVLLAALLIIDFLGPTLLRIICHKRVPSRPPVCLSWFVGPLLLCVGWLVLDQLWLYVSYGSATLLHYWKGMQDPAAVTSRLDWPIYTVLKGQYPFLVRYAAAMIPALLVLYTKGFTVLLVTLPALQMGQWAFHPADHFTRYSVPAVVVMLIAAATLFGRMGAFQRANQTKYVPLLAIILMTTGVTSTLLLLWDVTSMPSGFNREERMELEKVFNLIDSKESVLAAHTEAYGTHHLWNSGYRDQAAMYFEAYSVLARLSSRTRIFDYRQLPMTRGENNKLRKLQLTEVMNEVDWCFVSQLGNRDAVSQKVRRSIRSNRTFEPVLQMGRLEVYRRVTPVTGQTR